MTPNSIISLNLIGIIFSLSRNDDAASRLPTDNFPLIKSFGSDDIMILIPFIYL